LTNNPFPRIEGGYKPGIERETKRNEMEEAVLDNTESGNKL